LRPIRTGREGFEHPTPGLVSQRTFPNNADKEPQAPYREDRWASALVRPVFQARTPADDVEGVGIKLALFVYMSGVDPETADSPVEQVLSAYKDCVRVVGRDLLAEVKGLMPANQQSV